jgi:hypothetical protein
MLPDDVFKEGSIAASPLEFDQPRRYLGVYTHNPPMVGPRIRIALLQVGLGTVDAKAFGTSTTYEEASYEVSIWQDTIYGFNIVQFDGWPDDWLDRRLNQIGFITDDTAHYNFEHGLVSQGDDFSIIFDIWSPEERLYESENIAGFEWHLYSGDTVVLSKTYPDDAWARDNRWLVHLTHEETISLVGDYSHEVLVTLATGEQYTILTGNIHFLASRIEV